MGGSASAVPHSALHAIPAESSCGQYTSFLPLLPNSCMLTTMTKDEAWVHFAATIAGDPSVETIDVAAECADDLLEYYDKRFPQVGFFDGIALRAALQEIANITNESIDLEPGVQARRMRLVAIEALKSK